MPVVHTAAVLAAEGVDDLGSDPDVDVDHEGNHLFKSLSIEGPIQQSILIYLSFLVKNFRQWLNL